MRLLGYLVFVDQASLRRESRNEEAKEEDQVKWLCWASLWLPWSPRDSFRKASVSLYKDDEPERKAFQAPRCSFVGSSRVAI